MAKDEIIKDLQSKIEVLEDSIGRQAVLIELIARCIGKDKLKSLAIELSEIACFGVGDLKQDSKVYSILDDIEKF